MGKYEEGVVTYFGGWNGVGKTVTYLDNNSKIIINKGTTSDYFVEKETNNLKTYSKNFTKTQKTGKKIT